MDFAFNRVYVRANEKGDEALAQRVRSEYLRFTVAVTDFAEKITSEIFGRSIPQTLLLHANDLNADVMDEMLKFYESRGYRFISLDEAMRHPAYQTLDTMVNSRGPTWLWRWSRSMGRDVSFRDEPEPAEWVMRGQ